ncbi:hypothetical protein AKJ16_DCAP17800 [Drosera capensis]
MAHNNEKKIKKCQLWGHKAEHCRTKLPDIVPKKVWRMKQAPAKEILVQQAIAKENVEVLSNPPCEVGFSIMSGRRAAPRRILNDNIASVPYVSGQGSHFVALTDLNDRDNDEQGREVSSSSDHNPMMVHLGNQLTSRKTSFNDISGRVGAVRARLLTLQQNRNMGHMQHIEEIKTMRAQLKNLLISEDYYFRQQAKDAWCKGMDRNSKYFRAVIKGRRRRRAWPVIEEKVTVAVLGVFQQGKLLKQIRINTKYIKEQQNWVQTKVVVETGCRLGLQYGMQIRVAGETKCKLQKNKPYNRVQSLDLCKASRIASNKSSQPNRDKLKEL